MRKKSYISFLKLYSYLYFLKREKPYLLNKFFHNLDNMFVELEKKEKRDEAIQKNKSDTLIFKLPLVTLLFGFVINQSTLFCQTLMVYFYVERDGSLLKKAKTKEQRIP